jgi:hypothetical protein
MIEVKPRMLQALLGRGTAAGVRVHHAREEVQGLNGQTVLGTALVNQH